MVQLQLERRLWGQRIRGTSVPARCSAQSTAAPSTPSPATPQPATTKSASAKPVSASAPAALSNATAPIEFGKHEHHL